MKKSDKVPYKEWADPKAWKKAFREGFCPSLSETELIALEKALASDDRKLIQGSTTVPPPLRCVQDWPVEEACPGAYCGWKGKGLKTIGEVEEYFALLCYDCDERLGEPAGCRHFLNWWDETPRPEAVPLLLEEVRKELKEREGRSVQ
jgi:hypothetical protein